MTSIQNSSHESSLPDLPRSAVSIKRRIYRSCLWVFVASTILRIALDYFWHWVSPHNMDVVASHTHALGGRDGTVFVTPLEDYCLDGLCIVPLVFLLVGMLAWASAWREWE